MKKAPQTLSLDKRVNKWKEFFKKQLGTQFRLIRCKNLLGLCLLIYSHESLNAEIDSKKNVALDNYAKIIVNKGAIAVKMSINSTNLTFITSHFSAGSEHTGKRNNQYLKCAKAFSGYLENSHVFWFGDFNYRLEDISVEEAKSLIEHKNYQELLKHDQVNFGKSKKKLKH
ncbi:Synaptojanin-1 [Bonamia ostreae]|uniref:Synaptojanin-1 n=1 Tax=Bonamia ostreae TaxID=126728 RepID=A0ABV2AS40_9EUKA